MRIGRNRGKAGLRMGVNAEPLASIEQKRKLLQDLKSTDKKYRKPFDEGEMAATNRWCSTCSLQTRS